MNTERPFEGNVPSGGEEPSYQWLDEWLCEYVDGTMDPSLKAVFEKYVEANPDLKAHIERLQETRDLLCNCGLSKEPPSDVEAKVCREVERDERQSSSSEAEDSQNRPVSTLGLVSSVTAALVVGFLFGATVVNVPATKPGSAPQTDPSTRSASSPQQSRATSIEPLDVRLYQYQSTAPLSLTDSAQSSSPLTPAGAP